MSYTYANRKLTKNAESKKDTLNSQPAMDALRSGAAQPTAEQMGHRVDLPDAMRAKMENAFGADLSAVKLYESQSVADAGAQAVTRGSDIAFAPGMLDFTSYGGQSLLGHEISHVVSQARGEVTGGGFLNDHALEARADREGAMAAAGQQIAVPAAAMSGVSAAPAAGPMQAKKPEPDRSEATELPQAEHEADRLSAGVTSGSPEAVKAEMGRKMGADFSDVRFHTDADSAAKADAMGAKAYASGADIYFDSKGFDPGVAAHELVHTVQQGVVSGGMQTVAAPAGAVQMKEKTKAELAAEQTKRNAKYNAKLAKMGPEAVERILSGKGGRFEKRKFDKIMKVLNGQSAAIAGNGNYNGELSEENIAMLYGSGAAGKKFITDRVVGNLTSHVKGIHDQNVANGQDPNADYGQYMSTLQNDAVRKGGGGALTEYGRLAQLVAKPATAGTVQSLTGPLPSDIAGLDPSDQAYKDKTTSVGQQMVADMPASMAGKSDQMREFNGMMMDKLSESMPELFNAEHEQTAKAFVGKSFALRGLFPSITNTKEVKENTFAVRSSQQGIKNANEMMEAGGGSAATQALREAMVPGFSPKAPAAAAPQTPFVPGEKTSDQTMAYRTTAVPQDYDPRTATEDESLAMMYNKIKNPSPDDDPDTISWRKQEFSRMRAAQMQAQERAAAQQQAAPKKDKKWWQFWKK